jgi:hypothetical protein
LSVRAATTCRNDYRKKREDDSCEGPSVTGDRNGKVLL